VGLAVGRPAGAGRAHAGRFGWIDEIHVEADVEPGGALGGDRDRLLHHLAHALHVDIAHGEKPDARAANVLALFVIRAW
jgi:hypothetical protein